jgi:hypothetical protein
LRGWLALGVVVLLGASIRVVIAARAPMWRDEAQTVALAARPFPSAILDGVRRDGNAPFFYLIEHFLVAPRGVRARELRDRALAVALGIAVLPLAFFAARRLTPEAAGGGATSGLAAVALLAFSPVAIDVSTQVRMYSGVAACAALVSLAAPLLAYRAEDAGWGPWICYGSAALAALYLHPFTVYWVAAFALATGAPALAARATRARWLVAHAAIAIAFLPGLRATLAQARELTLGGRVPWGTTPGWLELLHQLTTALTGIDATSEVLRPDAFTYVAAAAALGLGVVALRRDRRATVVALAGALALVLAYLGARWTAAFRTRYNIGAITASAIVVGAGVGTLLQAGRWWVRGVGLAALALVLGVQLRANRAEQKKIRSDAREVARILLEHAGASDLVVTIPDVFAVPLNYYLPPGLTQLDLPELGRVDAVDWRGWPDRLSDEALAERFEHEVERAAQEGRALWLVCWAPLRGGLPRIPISELFQTVLPKQWALAYRSFHAIDDRYLRIEPPWKLPPAREAFYLAGYESRLTREP